MMSSTATATTALLLLAGCSSEPRDAGEPRRDAAPDAHGGTTGTGGASNDSGSAGRGGARDADLPDGGTFLDASARRLSDTGLFSDLAGDVVAEGVEAYVPRFELWADGATKRRFLQLPSGTTIDATNPDGWVFPIGTKAWKEFSVDGERVETRLFEKVGSGPDGWRYVAFVWRADQTDADEAPLGVRDAGGTPHDVPAQSDCYGCHVGSADMLLGVSAVQLGWDTTGMAPRDRTEIGTVLEDLVAEDRLSPAPAAASVPLPGSAGDQAALGALHANCGHCHQPGTVAWERAEMDLHLWLPDLSDLSTTSAFRTAVDTPTARIFDGVTARVEPGLPEQSGVYVRMASRVSSLQMPPIATEVVDDAGSTIVYDWIAAMPLRSPDAGADAGVAGDAGDGGGIADASAEGG